MNDPRRLQQAIRDLHGLEAVHVGSVLVVETFDGKPVWEGDVEVFRVRGHSQAEHAYAWTYEDDDGKLHHVAVLGVPPVDSPQNAVKAAVVAHIKRQQQP
jgi:hypothetical protein